MHYTRSPRAVALYPGLQYASAPLLGAFELPPTLCRRKIPGEICGLILYVSEEYSLLNDV